MSKRSTIILTAALLLGAASTAMAMGGRNSVGRHSGPAVGQTAAFIGDYRFSAAGVYRTAGRQVAAPPWSFACITDHGPRVWCDEPVRFYAN
jgi:hypothetical protein